MKPLYALTADWLAVQELLGEDGEPDWIYLQDTLESIEGAVEQKAANIVYVIKNLSVPITAIDEEIKRLRGRKEVIQHGVDRLKDYIKTNMEAMNLDKIETDLIKIRLQNSPPSCEVTNQDFIPREYTTSEVVIHLDKKKAIADMKAGKQVAGLELRQGKHIRIY